MPSLEEKEFFLKSFHLIDSYNNGVTNWYNHYSVQVSKTTDGRVDWDKIPGFLSPSEHGYKIAVTKVFKRLKVIIANLDLDAFVDDEVKLREIKSLAQKIAGIRKRAFKRHTAEDKLIDTGHEYAVDIWSEELTKLEKAFHEMEENRFRIRHRGPDVEAQMDYTQPRTEAANRSTKIINSIILAVGVSVVVAIIIGLFKFLQIF